MENTLKKQSLDFAVEANNTKSLNEELIKKGEVWDTPFSIITVNEKCFGVMGAYAITEQKEAGQEEELALELQKITWNRIIQVVSIILDAQNKQTTK